MTNLAGGSPIRPDQRPGKAPGKHRGGAAPVRRVPPDFARVDLLSDDQAGARRAGDVFPKDVIPKDGFPKDGFPRGGFPRDGHAQRAALPPDAAPATPPRPARAAPDPGPTIPVPPHDHEKYLYVKRHGWLLTLFSVLSFVPLAFSQLQMLAGSRWFWLYSPFVAMGIVGFLLPLFTDRLGRSFDLAAHKRLVARWRPARYPSVDIYLPVCGEPVEVIRNTWDYVSRLRRRYRGPTTTYVLDDGKNPGLKAMAREYGFAYATRPDRGWYKKSGNLRYGFHLSDGEFILLLDADFAPREDLLDETLPYMHAYPDTGIVQTPQYFHVSDQQTWIERGAGSVQELFYRYIQTSRAEKGGAICCGSCAVYRRSALEENGGMSLAEHSEDLRTGFDLQLLGWKLRYLPIALSTGNCPDNMPAFVNQQYRWCQGTLSLLQDKAFWKAKLSMYVRLAWLTSFIYYLYSALYTFAIPAFSVAMLIFAPSLFRLRNLVYFVPYLFYLFIVYPAWHRAPYRLEAWAARVIIGWANVFVFWDTVRGKPRTWRPTGASGGGQGGRRFWLGVAAWSGGTSVLWAGLAFWRMVTMSPYNFFLIFILGLFELVVAGRVLIQPKTGATG